ncbi:MAG: DsbE family thiol:disulfide interchange protein [Alphaproteobacteria bacterium]|nr:DsbE family thiol:disulfide interchange protein [Alphaproteobacteria bacterium]
MSRWLLMVPMVVFAILLIWLAAGLQRDPQALPSALIDQTIPQFSLPLWGEGLAGQKLTESDLRQGKPILVNFFASWCLPCRQEAPELARLKARGVSIIGIGYKDQPAAVQQFLAEVGNPYERIGLDLEGRVGIDFGIYGVPETFIIDGAGVIRWRMAGVLTPDVIAKHLEPIVQQLSTASESAP